MDENLKGKVAVVTGSGQGIGRSIAIAMGKEGAKVVTNNRKPGSTGFAIMDESLVENLSSEEKEALKKKSEEARVMLKQLPGQYGMQVVKLSPSLVIQAILIRQRI